MVKQTKAKAPWWRRDWFLDGVLVVAILIVYLPAAWAGYVWDDDSIVTMNPVVTGLGGLKTIWMSKAADICPLTLSTFWIEYRLWGPTPFPYHLVNVLFHAGAALVLLRVLRRLRIPGAWLGAALWAVHPVMVESVAWISEMKNTESGFFFLLSILYFLRNAEPGAKVRDRRWAYALCLLFAALAMASKSSTVVLPVVTLLGAWWLEGRWTWRALARTAPIFGLALVVSLVSIWTQHEMPGYRQVVMLPWPERFVMAADAIWFYLGKLIWPQPLILVYPLWQIRADGVLDWLPVLALVAAFVALGWSRKARPALFAFVYFLVALLPVLGFVGMTYFRHSYVADHFQYLASIGPLALAAAGVAVLSRSLLSQWKWLVSALVAVVLLTAGTVSWQRVWVFQNGGTAWSDVLDKNQQPWIAWNSLGIWYFQAGQLDRSLQLLKKAADLAPDVAAVRYDYGRGLAQKGETAEAEQEFQAALQLDPDMGPARNNLGIAYGREGRLDKAIAQFSELLKRSPDYAQAHYNLGVTLLQKQNIDGAIIQLQRALQLDPKTRIDSLAFCYSQKGELDKATELFQRDVERHPNNPNARNNLGGILMQRGQMEAAIEQFQMALQIDPNNVQAQKNLEMAKAAAAGRH